MNDNGRAPHAAAVAAARTAGGMIRAARQAQGMPMAALASAIKVSPHKLELLESDRFDELPDATFVRALAQTVCRSLKIDPQPVLAQLPQAAGHRLDQISEGLNRPFRDRPNRQADAAPSWVALARPAVWGSAALVLAALALYLVPGGWLTQQGDSARRWLAARASAVPEAAGSGVAATPSQVVEVLSTAAPVEAELAPTAAGTAALPAAEAASTAQPAPMALSTAPLASYVPDAPAVPTPTTLPAAVVAPAVEGTPPSAAADGTLQLRANAVSWVEVVDARSRVLLSRRLQEGETIALDGALPLRLKVGNALGTEAVFRGRVLDLASNARDNVARLELK